MGGSPRRAARLAAALLAGAGWSLGAAPHSLFAVALPSLAVLFALALSAPPRRAGLEGFLFGLVAYALMLRWFAAVLLEFTDLGALVAAGAVLGAGVVEGLLLGAGTALVASTARRAGRSSAAWLAAGGWVGLAWARQAFPLPFPWGTAAAAVSSRPLANGIAAGIGAWGLELVLASTCAGLAMVSVGGGRRRAAVLLLAASAGLGAGAMALGSLGRTNGPETVTVAAIQGALARDADGWDRFVTYERMTLEAAARGARLVVWPESAVPYRLDRDAGYRRLLERLAARSGADIVVNTVDRDEQGDFYNVAALVRADGAPGGRYRKRRLVPFGEYLPLRFLFGRMPALAAQAGDFSAADRATLLSARCGGIGALVCFEAVFPDLAEEHLDAGARLLVNLTNDSWFGWTEGPAQHLAHARLRAAETGLPLVRAAHSGISVILSSEGRELARLGLGERGVLAAAVHAGGRAPGGRVGRAIGRLCATLAALWAGAAVVGAWRARRRTAAVHAGRSERGTPSGGPERERSIDDEG